MAEKETARYTLQGEKGYRPRVGAWAENGPIVGAACREGNAAPAAGHPAFIRYCESYHRASGSWRRGPIARPIGRRSSTPAKTSNNALPWARTWMRR